MVSSAKGQ